MYYYAEIRGGDVINSATNWIEISAADLPAAKKEAMKGQMFQGTSLFIAVHGDEGFRVVSEKVCDPINMRLAGKWRNTGDEDNA